MADVTSKQYKVYITPKISEFAYGDEVQVDAEILFNGIKTMKKSIDSSDYEIGVYTYGDIALKVDNKDGKYNDEMDKRSIFNYTRDLAKVRVDYSDNNGDVTRFRGLINEEATKQDLDKKEVKFRVLSNDSVIRTTRVAGGLIPNGSLASTAVKNILNQTKITSILNYSASNIALERDFTIDNGSKLENKSSREALNQILTVSNSVLIIDSSDNIIVKPRDFNDISLLSLYGPYDLFNRQNILGVKSYNNGRHRTFTSVKLAGYEVTDSAFAADYGYRQIEKEADFITNDISKASLAQNILDDFKAPRIELELTCPTHVVKDVNLLDPISLNYPLRIERYESDFLPVIGITKIDDADQRLPNTYGDIDIKPNVAFKIIETSENPLRFETTLKLRQFGYYTDVFSSYVGFAVIGESVIGGTGDACAKWNPAVIGGGYLGCTKVG